MNRRGKITYSGRAFNFQSFVNVLNDLEFLLSVKDSNEVVTTENIEALFKVLDTVRVYNCLDQFSSF